jgi:hypothetical protein
LTLDALPSSSSRAPHQLPSPHHPLLPPSSLASDSSPHRPFHTRVPPWPPALRVSPSMPLPSSPAAAIAPLLDGDARPWCLVRRVGTARLTTPAAAPKFRIGVAFPLGRTAATENYDAVGKEKSSGRSGEEAHGRRGSQ